jgi:hypothetical protein
LRLVDLPARLQGFAEIAHRLDIVGFEPYGLPQLLHRKVRLIRQEQRIPEIVSEERFVGPEADCRLHQPHGLSITAALGLDRAEQMQGVGLILIDAERLPVTLCGPVQIFGGMQRDSAPKQLADVGVRLHGDNATGRSGSLV